MGEVKVGDTLRCISVEKLSVENLNYAEIDNLSVGELYIVDQLDDYKQLWVKLEGKGLWHPLKKFEVVSKSKDFKTFYERCI